MTTNILFFGSKYWTDRAIITIAINDLVITYLNFTMLVGDAKGADKLSREIALTVFHLDVMKYPANWRKYGKAADYIRDVEMRDDKPVLGVCFHEDLWGSKRSKMMFRLLQEWHIPVWHFNAKGDMVVYE
jgi:hypothetical protein